MKKVFLFFVFLSLFYSCAETDNNGSKTVSCAGITCSGHGTCELKDNAPQCKCDGGYINMGAECLFDCSAIENSVINTYNNGCVCPNNLIPQYEGETLVSCGCKEGKVVLNGVCVESCEDPNAEPAGPNNTCICKEGYYLDISGTCSFDCRNIPHAYTNSTNDGCDCEENYTPNQNGECEYACNKEGNMKPNASNTSCVCLDGYFQANVEDLCLNPCENVSCESGFTCKGYSYDTNMCTCDSGKTLSLRYADKKITPFKEYSRIKVATGKNSYIVVWSANTTENDNIKSIFAMILDMDGNITKEPFLVNSRDLSDTKDKVNPVVTFGGDKYMIAWEDYRFTTDSMTARDIYYKLIPESGNISGVVEKRLTFSPSNNTYAWGIKLLWNEAKSNFAIFWKERKRDADNNLGETTIYYRLINPDDASFLTTTKQTTMSNISIYDFDVTVNKDNNYSMLWINDDSPRRLHYQILSSDISTIENEGVIIKEPFSLIYNDYNISAPKIFWTGKDYSIFFKSSYYSNRYTLLKLNENDIKEEKERSINFTDSVTNFIYNGNDFLFTSFYGNELYVTKIAFNGKRVEKTRVSDGLGHVNYPYLLFFNNSYKAFWLDDRDGNIALYFSSMGCY